MWGVKKRTLSLSSKDWVELDRESSTWKKLKTAAIEEIYQALSTLRTWFLLENMTPQPISKNEPHSTQSSPGRHSERAYSGHHSEPLSPALFSPAHHYLENKAL